MTRLDKEAVRHAYEEVRDDKSETTWIVLKYEGNTIIQSSSGSSFSEFRDCFRDDERAFAYIRMNTGDEMSKRAKFAFVTWCGHNVNAIKRAKLSIDKAIVKEIISNFAIEILASEQDEIIEENIKDLLVKAGGANYGTGVRD